MCGTLRVPRLDYGTRSDRPLGSASRGRGRGARGRRGTRRDPTAPVFDSCAGSAGNNV